MAIVPSRCPWKPSLFTQYRIRIANELRLAQSNESCEALRRRIVLVEEDIIQLVKQIPSIDFVQLEQTLKSCQTKQQRTLAECSQVKQQLTQLTPKLLIGNAYFRARLEDVPLAAQAILPKKRRKRLKLSLDQQWRKGVGDAYRRLQTQRDKEDLSRPDSSVHISERLVTPHDFPLDEPPFLAQTIPDFVREHEFLPPLPPPAIDEVIIPFQTPPPPPSIAARSPPSDRLQLAADDTIVKPHRLVNKTLGNITQMSFHIDPEQCSSPKGEDRKKKHKLKKAMLPPPPPPPPLFSSTAIFDTNAFFTQTTSKAKKQKKKIDISRQPAVLTTNDVPKKRGRTKKSSPYDFQDDDDDTTLSTTKGAKVLADDFITARFAKNSHFQSHQSSMASTKSSKSQRRCTERERKKQKKNVLGIGTSSPLRPGKGNRTR